MSERRMVRQPSPCPGHHRSLASPLQHHKTAFGPRLPNASRLPGNTSGSVALECYDHPRKLSVNVALILGEGQPLTYTPLPPPGLQREDQRRPRGQKSTRKPQTMSQKRPWKHQVSSWRTTFIPHSFLRNPENRVFPDASDNPCPLLPRAALAISGGRNYKSRSQSGKLRPCPLGNDMPRRGLPTEFPLIPLHLLLPLLLLLLLLPLLLLFYCDVL